MEIDGYVLDQWEDHEEDNMKIFHEVRTPRGEVILLNHTPYEHLTMAEFRIYVEYHKALGFFPERQELRGGSANWCRDTLHLVAKETDEANNTDWLKEQTRAEINAGTQ